MLHTIELDPSLLGVMQIVAVTVRQFGISSRVCSRCNPGLHLLNAIELITNWRANLEDGSVFTRGLAICGGDSSAVRDQLKGV